MKIRILIILIISISFLFSCKNDKKEPINTTQEQTEQKEVLEVKKGDNAFEEKLLDLREINLQFNDSFKLNKFGMLKLNDSVYGFVFKLDDLTTKDEVEKFSVGIIGHDSKLSKPFKASFSPIIEKREGSKYLIMSRVINNTRYFDSLDVYTYKRKDWKASGRISSIKLEDIFFEEK